MDQEVKNRDWCRLWLTVIPSPEPTLHPQSFCARAERREHAWRIRTPLPAHRAGYRVPSGRGVVAVGVRVRGKRGLGVRASAPSIRIRSIDARQRLIQILDQIGHVL